MKVLLISANTETINMPVLPLGLAFMDSLNPEAMKITTGIRIYPNTLLADIAVKEGIIAPDDNLLMPKFYIRKELEDWLIKTIHKWAENRENCFF